MANSLQGLGTPQGVGFPVTLGCMCDGDAPSSSLSECTNYQSGVPAYNYYSAATADDPANPCYPIIFGCTNPLADNFIALIPDVQVDVNTDDGSCSIAGCMDPTAFNYDSTATSDDGSCIPIVVGCLDATTTQVSWTQYGCVDNGSNNCTEYFNYIQTPGANTSGTCTQNVSGCMDGPHPNGTVDGCGYGLHEACNYAGPGNTNGVSPPATVHNYQCTLATFGCTDPNSCDYDASATVDDGSCTYCDDNTANNYDPTATCNSGCLYCHRPNGFVVQSQHTTNTTIRLRWFNNSDAAVVSYTVFWSNDNFSTTSSRIITGNGNGVTGFGVSGSPVKIDVGTLTPLLTGTTYNFYVETNCSNTNSPVTSTVSDTTTATYGCIDDGSNYTSTNLNPAGGTHAACNYSPIANFDDGSCEYNTCYGCIASSACNWGGAAILYDDGATCEWESCVDGCMTSTDCTYNYNCGQLPAAPIAGPNAGIPNAQVDGACGPLNNGCSGQIQFQGSTSSNYIGCSCAFSPNGGWGGYVSQIDITVPGCTINAVNTYTALYDLVQPILNSSPQAYYALGDSFNITTYLNYDALATCNDSSCEGCDQYCNDPAAINTGSGVGLQADVANPNPPLFPNTACVNNNLCCYGLAGCMDPNATNYTAGLPLACSSPSTCQYPIQGCIDDGTYNTRMVNMGYASAQAFWEGTHLGPHTPYNLNAGNGCIPWYGTGDYPTGGALNHYAGAGIDAGSCTYIEGCMDDDESSTAGYTDVNGFCPDGSVGTGSTYGCTDMSSPVDGYLYSNYDPCADEDWSFGNNPSICAL